MDGINWQKVQDHIEGTGETALDFVNRAINETIGRDRQLSEILKLKEKIYGGKKND